MLDSVARQGSGPGEVEHLVLDAGSTDGTIDTVARHPHVTLICEPDGSAHEAMNKGIARARGEIITFVNADDLVEDDAFAAARVGFDADPSLDILAGHAIVFADDVGSKVARIEQRGDGLVLNDLMYGVPAINARYFRRRLFTRLGAFETGFLISADRALLLRAALAGARGAVLDRVVYRYRQHGGSRTLNPDRRHAAAIAAEHGRIARALLASLPPDAPARAPIEGWLAYETMSAAMRRKAGIVVNLGHVARTVAAEPRLVAALPRGLVQKLGMIRRRMHPSF
jgi:glycosyltransferase involved in cell wall biosynthesis